MASIGNDNGAGYRSKLAGEYLSSYQYRFVTLESDDCLDYADSTTDNPYGILQNAPTSGLAAAVKVFGESKIEAGEALTVNTVVQTDATGRAITLSTGGFPKGRITEAAGAAGDLAVVEMINPGIASS